MALQASFFSSFSSSSSSFSYEWSYDVFLSFRGFDTRHGFTGNLYKALCDRGIRTFIDDEELQRGEEITPTLVKAIQESRIAIPVFSKNYASSSFCLDELVIVMEYIKGKGPMVLPIFYDVDPCDVRHQRGSYGEAMAKHEDRFKDVKEKVQKWRKALYQAANVSGKDFKLVNEYEYVFIEKIAKEISNKISRVPLHVADYPVGLESRVLEVNSLLNDGFDGGVLMVGIYGIGGVGKTTLARAVYNFIADQFEGLCFLENVRENSIKHGLVHLQEKLLYKILGEKDIKLESVYEGIPIIKHRLHQKKVLLVLDDVDMLDQLRKIVGGPNWFGFGSRVIITTRDKQLLASHGIKRKYEAKHLSENEALELLSWNAFKCENVDPSYKDILKKAVTYACRLPLALEVIGSNLFGKSIEKWESALDQYKRIPNKKIQNILKISFDALEEYQQKIFPDIACSSKGNDWAEVKDILYARHDVCLNYGICVLAEKSLIKIYKNGWVTIHDLILDMGKEIVRQESPKKPGNRSRLWLPKDIVQVLEHNTGTSEIETIILDAPISEEVVVKWDGEAFKKMTNLETLIIRNACFSQGAKYLPNSLRVLEWWNYPSNSLPYDFHPKMLAILKLLSSGSMLVRFVEKQKLMNLGDLILDNANIKQIPDVSGVPNLEILSFDNCVNLIKVHESVGFLNKLCYLSASNCTNLRSFPPLMLPSLEEFNLSKCSSLESFPEILGEMDGIKEISWHGTSITKIPSSITNLTMLEDLAIEVNGMLRLPSSIATLPYLEQVSCSCSGVLQFPKQDEGEEQGSSMVSSTVEYVIFEGCNMSDESVPIVLAWFRNVVYLNLSKNNFAFLPVSIKELCSLETLRLDDCKKLAEIRGIPPNMNSLSAKNCTSLSSSSRSMLLKKELHKDGDKMFHFPGSSIPKWFKHSSRQNSISFWFRNRFPSISAFVVRGPDEFYVTSRFRFEMIINGFRSDFMPRVHFLEPGHIITLDERIKPSHKVDKAILENEWNHVVCRVRSVGGLVIKKFGIHVLKHKSNMEDIRFTNPFLLQKEDVNIGDFQRNMQPQKKLASVGLLEMQRGKRLSLRLPPTMNSLNDNVNWGSNSITLMQISSSTSDQALSKDKGKDLMVYNQSREQISIHSCRQELLDMNLESNSIKLAPTSDTIREGSFPDNLCTSKLGLDYEAMGLSCHAYSNADSDSDFDSDSNSDSDSIMSSLARLTSDNDRQGGMELLSLRPSWEETLDCGNRDSNLLQSASTSDIIRDQGCGMASRKRKRSTLMLDLNNEPNEMFCHAHSDVDFDSDSKISRLASDTSGEGGSCHDDLCTCIKVGYQSLDPTCSDDDDDDDLWMYGMESLSDESE